MGRITDNRADVYQEITDQMIAMIEAGTRPWSKSWNGSTAPDIRCDQPALHIAASTS